jgi:hypothetical protein
VEVLHVTFYETVAKDHFPWRRFLQKFPSLKTLRTEGANDSSIARFFSQYHEEPGDDLAFLPALEEIKLGSPFENYESHRGPDLAALQPFNSARQQAGRPVKVSSGPWSDLSWVIEPRGTPRLF